MKSIYMDDRWENLQAPKEGGIAYRHIYENQGIRIVYLVEQAGGPRENYFPEYRR